jgi:hypothetical protein
MNEVRAKGRPFFSLESEGPGRLGCIPTTNAWQSFMFAVVN